MGRLKKSVKLMRLKAMKYPPGSSLALAIDGTFFWGSRNSKLLPPPDVRYDLTNHLPARTVKTQMAVCQREGCDRYTTVRCLKCNVYLCLGTRKQTNCYFSFHMESCKENAEPASEEDLTLDEVQEVPASEVKPEPELQIVEASDPLKSVERAATKVASKPMTCKLPYSNIAPFLLLIQADPNTSFVFLSASERRDTTLHPHTEAQLVVADDHARQRRCDSAACNRPDKG